MVNANVLMTGMESLAREEERNFHEHHVIEVFRDPTSRTVRFHILVSDRRPSFAHFDVLVNFSKWETLHFLLPSPRSVEESLPRLFVAAGRILNWPT